MVNLPVNMDADADPPNKTTSAAQPEQPSFALATVTDFLSADLTLEDGPKRPRVTHAADEGQDARVRFDGRITVIAGRHLAVAGGRQTRLEGTRVGCGWWAWTVTGVGCLADRWSRWLCLCVEGCG